MPPPGYIDISPGMPNPGPPPNCPVAGLIMPIVDAICAINAIWFIIISCSIRGFVIAGFIMSIPMGKPALIIMACCCSGVPLWTMLSMRDWISSCPP
jgi:hypothetical protein